MDNLSFVIGPADTGALVYGYEYFQNKNLQMMDHLKVAGLAVATSAASNLLFKALPLPESLEMVAQPGLAGVGFAFGRKQFLTTRNTLIMDIIEGSASDLAGNFVGKTFSSF